MALNWFNFSTSGAPTSELVDIYPLSIQQSDFIEGDVISIYSKILTDVAERTHGLDQTKQLTLWDNCLISEASRGLITHLATAMTKKDDLFLVYEKAINVLREATPEEQNQIRADYKKANKSSVGIFVSFKNYRRTDFVKVYSAFEFFTISSLNKQVNLSKAIQFKMKNLRAGVSLTDSAQPIAQAKSISDALSKGHNVLLDEKDKIETSKPELDSIEKSIAFINEKRSFYLGLPASYITGILNSGLGDSGQADTKAIERGLKNYFFSIMKPVLEALYGASLSYKSQDYAQINQGLEALKTFELTGTELISLEDKQRVINQLFDFDTEAGSDE